MRNATHSPITHATAALAVALAPTADAASLPDGMNVQLFPDGDFDARDGRPGSLKGCTTKAWRFDADIAAALIARTNTRETPLFIDYEHHTLTAKDAGHKAVAAGWIEALAYVPGRGLFARVAWTDAARAHIRADEYRYISPLFTFDPESGAVLSLVNAALTNSPALDGMAAVAAVRQVAASQTDQPQPEDCMDELLKRLRFLLNLPVAATAEDVTARLDALKTQVTTGAETAASVDLLAILAGKDAAIADLTAKAATPDPARFAPVEALSALTAENTDLKARLAAAATQNGAAALSAEIKAAVADGRVHKSLEGWLADLAAKAPDAARDYLAKAAPVAALTAMQTSTVTPPAGAGTAALTAEEKEAAKLLGIPEDVYATGKEAK
ncbi:phage protease [Solidesulfovibrio carbinolicus]|uniref:Peptidase n=1 Tax=Solidesulfovibrio carbinolicus TaxID=296842 RepID=A0A4P6HPF6_9BACT|nr:phage protease [Solidesulfovibrio carbinolicus]QAZ67038.1 peptidase [Solidesulfovibrio carbinolicus]